MLHILIATDDDLVSIATAAESGGELLWIVPKRVEVGDTCLLSHMGGGLMARGVSNSTAELQTVGHWKGRYKAMLSGITVLADAISHDELAAMFPSWGWPKYPRMYTTPPDVVAEKLWELALDHTPQAPPDVVQMKDFGSETDAYRQVVEAMKSIVLTTKESDDLRYLYEHPHGVEYTLDSRNRPQGETIGTCRNVGSRIKRVLGTDQGYGMNWIGYSHRKKNVWLMKPEFRAVIERLGLFGTSGGRNSGASSTDETESVADEEERKIANDQTIPITERDQLIKARVGQGKFRERVELLEPACRITGVRDRRFLRASHIKPWAKSTHAEKLDGANGLLLAPHVDHLFDKGFISFDDDGNLLISEDLPASVISAWSLVQSVPPRPLTRKQAKYMTYHRANEFGRHNGSVSIRVH